MFFHVASAAALLWSFSGASSDKFVATISSYAAHRSPRPVAQGIRIGWDKATMARISEKQFRNSGYARMIELQSGALLCVYEADGSVMATCSADSGKSWNEAVPVAWHQDGINMAAPDVIQLADGSILCCYNPRPWKISGSRTFGIRTRKSYDGGKTWIHGRLIYEAGHKFGDGCWEPSAIQLPDGEIQVYFANEGIYRESKEQNISMLTSKDGGLTWSKEPTIVSFRPGARDGMPSPLLLQNGKEIAVAIEDLGWLRYFTPAIVRTDATEPWPETVGALHGDRHAALEEPFPYKKYGGAPYLRQLPTGETLLSYQGTEDRKNHFTFADMKVAIGDPDARNFDRTSIPFEVPLNRNALWNSMTVLEDSTVIALTSTNAFTFLGSEVWMIKGYIIPEVEASRQSLRIDGYETDSAWDGPLPLFTRRNGSTRYRGGVAYDNDYLFFYSRVSDKKVVCDSADPENNDGLAVSVDVNDRGRGELASAKPGDGSLKFFLSADNVLVMKTGVDGRWIYRSPAGTAIKHATRKNDSGYIQELALPWSLLGGKPPAGRRLGLNVGLTENSGKNVPDYRESISGNHEDKPYTWLSLRLR